MSRTIRIVKTIWGDATSLFVDTAEFESMLFELANNEIPYDYNWHDVDMAFKFWTAKGELFLDRIRDIKLDVIMSRMEQHSYEEVKACLENMKTLEPDWRKFLDKDGALELWIDG